MISMLSIFDTTLPVTDPVLRFLIVLIIILAAPLLLNKIKIPHLIGLIIAGAVIGPNGFNILERDSSIVVTGTTGLLYIMFLAGLEIDMAELKRNGSKSLVFGLYTFLIPLVLGFIASRYILNYSLMSSILMASLISSHTLLAYPIVSKLGVAKNKAVTIAVGGTVITDVLALLVLAVIVGMTQGEVDGMFWVKMGVSVLLFGAAIMLLFPIIGRWFFKKVDDKISQYIFVLVMMYFGALLAELAGVEAIIGAFLAGLAMNQLIPHTSTLMNRVEFVGNAYFIPFFLISVGMLIDYKAFFTSLDTLKVGVILTIAVTLAKFLAAWATQKTYKLSRDQRRLIFGLSYAQAAATLAVVLVGYNIIIDETATGEPIRLLDEHVLNGSILTILISCTYASLVAQKGAQNIALKEASEVEPDETGDNERILIPMRYIETADDLVQLGITIKSKNNTDGLFALNVVEDTDNEASEKKAKKIIETAATAAISADVKITPLVRYDTDAVNGIVGIVKEHDITDIVLGLSIEKGISRSFFGNLTEGILKKCDTTTLIYKATQPLSTIKRHIILVPANAEKEIGFAFWLIKIWNIARNTGAKLVFYSTGETLNYIKKINDQHPVPSEFIEFDDWDDFLIFSRETNENDNLIIVMSRRENISYNQMMYKIPSYLNKYFKNNSFILIYPKQLQLTDKVSGDINYRDPAIHGSMEIIDEITNSITKLFKMK